MPSNCLPNGLDRRQIIPTVRDGPLTSKRLIATAADRVSTCTAISGMSVTPIPAPTI